MEEDPRSRPTDDVDSMDIFASLWGIPCTIPGDIPGVNTGWIPWGIPWINPDGIPVADEEGVRFSLHFLLLPGSLLLKLTEITFLIINNL